MSGGQYLLGDYDKERDKLVVTSAGLFNFGAAHPSGVHAPSATPDGKGGVIVIFNMNPGFPTEGWNQIDASQATLATELRMEPAGGTSSGTTTGDRRRRQRWRASRADGASELVDERPPVARRRIAIRTGGSRPMPCVLPRRLQSADTERRFVLLIDPSRRALACPGDGAGAPRPGRAAAASGVRRPQRLANGKSASPCASTTAPASRCAPRDRARELLASEWSSTALLWAGPPLQLAWGGAPVTCSGVHARHIGQPHGLGT